MSAVPPRYSAELAQSVPTYSSEPLAGEQRLELNQPQVTRHAIRSETFTRENRSVSLLLTQQENGVTLPTYGRNGTIRGVVFLKDTEDILAVTLKVTQHYPSALPFSSLRGRSTVSLILWSRRVVQVALPLWQRTSRFGKVTR